MARFAIEYKETYGDVFYVEANSSEEAIALVEEKIDEEPDILSRVEMESSGLDDITENWHREMPEDEWKKDLDFVD